MIRRSRRPPYRLFSLLLDYPADEVLAARPELAAAVAALPRSREKAALELFFDYFGAGEPGALQRAYVETFDLQRRASLYLTYFSEGDTRRRGQALLRLKRLYAAAGFELDGRELPDYLPVMLEFAEAGPEGAGRQLLAENRRGLELLRLHLADVGSHYRHLVEGLCAGLPKLRAPDLEAVSRLLREGPPAEQVGLQPYGPPELVGAEAPSR